MRLAEEAAQDQKKYARLKQAYAGAFVAEVLAQATLERPRH